ncbi:MAG: hypothetical protein ACI9G1_005071 [Pirellulaceae bacterium]|jgi:hypothetical protein
MTTNANEAISPAAEPTQTQRDWSRINASEEQIDVLIQLGVTISGELANKSLGGIAVVIENASNLELGQGVTVTYYGAPVKAIVRRLHPIENGRTEVGLEWQYSD